MSASDPKSRLEAHHLQKAYGSRKVVKSVSLSVDKGEVVGLLGPNGAGKTTSFYMIVGLVRADAGQISIDGQPVERMPIHRRARLGLSYLPQESSIFRKLTVEENVRAVLELQRDSAGKPLSKADIKQRTDSLLHELRVEHLRDSPAPALSGGERRRYGLWGALQRCSAGACCWPWVQAVASWSEGCVGRVAMRPGKRRALPDTPDGKLQDLIETAKAHIRSKVEHPFRVIKQQFGFQKTRLRGLAKNRCKINVMAALSNLFQARRHLLATV